MRKLCCLSLLLISVMCQMSDAEAQRRQRPGSMRHDQKEFTEQSKTEKVSCTYVSAGHTFVGDAYVYNSGAGIKIGKVTLTFKAGKYTLSFDGERFKVIRPKKRNRYEKVLNDFSMSGKYETFKKYDKIYLRLYEEGSDTRYMTDIPLEGKDSKYFELNEDELLFKFTLK